MTCLHCEGWGCSDCGDERGAFEVDSLVAQARVLTKRLQLVTLERDTLAAELERIRSGKEDAAQWQEHAAAFHRAESQPFDTRTTPAETPSAKAVEAALRGLGPTTEGEP